MIVATFIDLVKIPLFFDLSIFHQNAKVDCDTLS